MSNRNEERYTRDKALHLGAGIGLIVGAAFGEAGIGMVLGAAIALVGMVVTGHK